MGGWLRITPASGSISGASSLTVIADPTGKPDGTYTGTITITLPGAVNSPILVPVTLRVGAQVQLNPSSLEFSYTPGGCPVAAEIGNGEQHRQCVELLRGNELRLVFGLPCQWNNGVGPDGQSGPDRDALRIL